MLLFFVLPCPSCPLSFNPHVYTFPSCVNAITWLFPTDICFTTSSANINTCCGTFLSLLSPNPSSPFSFVPNVHTVPFVFSVTV